MKLFHSLQNIHYKDYSCFFNRRANLSVWVGWLFALVIVSLDYSHVKV